MLCKERKHAGTTDVVNTMCILQQALIAEGHDRHEAEVFTFATPSNLALNMLVT